jgi:hypothetical protein
VAARVREGGNLSDPHRRSCSSIKKARWLTAKTNFYALRGPMALMWVKFAAELLDNFFLTRVEFGNSSACNTIALLREMTSEGDENQRTP